MIMEFRDHRIFGKGASELTSARQNLSGAGVSCGVSLSGFESQPRTNSCATDILPSIVTTTLL